MPPLISVVIPCYAQARFLSEAIESVARQEYPAHEIIVVDDCSPDAVADVCARYPVLLYRTRERSGVGAARNLGLNYAEGEYVVCLDADDRLLPAALGVGAEVLAGQPDLALTWGARRLIDANGEPIPAVPELTRGLATYEGLLRGNSIGPPVGVMFRRSALAAAGGFASHFSGAEDYEMYLRLVRQSRAFGHGQLIAEYRIHGANMSSNDAMMFQALRTVFDAQEPLIASDRKLRRAVAAGRRWARESYDLNRRLLLLKEHRRARRWGKALLDTLGLLWHYPAKSVPILARRAGRAVISHP